MADIATTRPSLRIVLAGPRGFCAGVDRAIEIVERALEKYGRPVYVRHEIVHNRHVVSSLEDKGAIFVKELDEVPDDACVIFSAHGVPKAIPAEAERRKMFYLDATCPLVSKVHREAERHHREGLQIVMIGHAGHPEVIGTMGQLPQGEVVLVEDVAQAQSVEVRDPQKLAFITQTTLSVDDTAEVVSALQDRFPAIQGPKKEDICYATTNRQEAVKAIAGRGVQAFLVVGAQNSSNSNRLVEVALKAGCDKAQLVASAADIDWSWFDDVDAVGLSAGASAPELLVQEVIDECRKRFAVELDEVIVSREDVHFKLPKALEAKTASAA